MSAGFFDASCPQCRRRFGWHGRIGDRPSCPHCGHKPAQATLDRVALRVEEFKLLMRTHPAKATGKQLAAQRAAAGLTLGQAARILGVERIHLCQIEEDVATLPPELAERMIEAYGLEVRE